MLVQYLRAAMHPARYEILEDDGSFFGEIPECRGVHANACTLEECRETLEEVLEEWILLRASRDLPLPTIDGVELNVKEGDAA
jgi:predicted RNase H-like HicB family nuclease